MNATLTVAEWAGRAPVPPDSDYARRFWLPVLGPTSFLLGQTLARSVAGVAARSFPLVPLAEAHGLGTQTTDNGPLLRSVRRLCRFGLARDDDSGVLAVRATWPLLDSRQVRRLPEWLRVTHDAAVTRLFEEVAA